MQLNLMKRSKYLLKLFNRSYSKKSEDIDTQSSVQEALKSVKNLTNLWKRSYNLSNEKILDLKGYLKDINLYILAYGKLTLVHQNKGALTAGPTKETIDGTTLKKLQNIKDSILKDEFKWDGVKRIQIPKLGKKTTRPLGLPSFTDKIVQEVLRLILEPIFEATFSNKSHGFRPGRSCHTALKMVNRDFKACRWIIEGDISKYFDSIDHNILIKLIEKKINDKLIIKLIKTGLKAKVISFNKENSLKEETPITGTPQGGILSPLLSNIYLNQFDHWIEQEKKAYDKGTRGIYNSEYSKLHKKIRAGKGDKKELLKQIKGVTRTDFFDDNYKRLEYVRYADDFIIGIRGPIKDAKAIKGKVSNFLKEKLNLTLSEEKTKITHITEGIKFLGHIIWKRFTFITQKYSGKYRRIIKKYLAIDADYTKLLNRLKILGFFEYKKHNNTKKIIATPCFQFLHLPQSETNKKINFILKGINEWFKFAGNKKRIISLISYILLYSTAKLYCAKFKIPSIKQVFARGGKDLSKSLYSRTEKILGVYDEKIQDWDKSLRKKGKSPNRKIESIPVSKPVCRYQR